ncbi:hypothetical protein HYT74_03935 [Candidatus Daviesbacteria bacterium]|nr:hypothetical protein [Candidatus Daviesbacteria bacterium]MBI4038808.1 hypothetical protein [Candidatus Daviesbacteria bacterium]
MFKEFNACNISVKINAKAMIPARNKFFKKNFRVKVIANNKGIKKNRIWVKLAWVIVWG